MNLKDEFEKEMGVVIHDETFNRVMDNFNDGELVCALTIVKDPNNSYEFSYVEGILNHVLELIREVEACLLK
jgi:hypothetical protein